MTHERAGRIPLTVAHRAGNNLDHLRRAEATGADFAEADVWLYRGQLEIRHEKTAGILPVLWDRWSLSARWSNRLRLSDLINAAGPQTRLLLDLKGVNRGLPTMVKRIINATEAMQPIAVCSQNWAFVDAFRAQPEIMRIYSIGSVRQLRTWQSTTEDRGEYGISIDARLLDASLVSCFRKQAEIVAPWGVLSLEQAHQLLEWGVTAINADSLDLLQLVKAWQAGTTSDDLKIDPTNRT